MSKIKAPVQTRRNNLADVIPLNTPYMLFIDPCNACNFKCNFCAPQSCAKQVHFKHMIMDLEKYKKVIDDVKCFPKPLKMLRLYTMGEPLMNPCFPEMVYYAKINEVSEYIETVTNGSLLNPALNQRIAESGIDRVRISVEGIDNDTYKNVCQTNLLIKHLVDNIRDLYERTRNTGVEVYVKTIDATVNTTEKKNIFYKMFEHISDSMFIESIAPLWPDFDELDDRYDYSNNKIMGGKRIEKISCCPFIFYGMVINPDGVVTPCCSDWKRGYEFGNAFKTPITKIWGNEKMLYMWREMLKGNRSRFSSCRNCQYLQYASNDNIDEAAVDILSRLSGI